MESDDFVTKLLFAVSAIIVAFTIVVVLFFHPPKIPLMTQHLSSEPSAINIHGDAS